MEKRRQIQNTQKSELVKIKSELIESVNFNESRSLWEDKRKQHEKGVWAYAALLATLLLILPIVVFTNGPTLLQHLTNIATALSVDAPESDALALALSNQITKFVILGIPILGYVWLTRILVRVFLSSRALMDDAHERRVMLDTYLYLTGEGKAEAQDRPLILNALFRPLPGNSPDIEPPNLNDVIRLSEKT